MKQFVDQQNVAKQKVKPTSSMQLCYSDKDMVTDVQISGNRRTLFESLCKIQFYWACVKFIKIVNVTRCKTQHLPWKEAYKMI